MDGGGVRLSLVVLRSRDLDRAQAFYGALGLSFVRHAHGNGPVHLASDSGGRVFELYPLAEEASATSGVWIGFCVPDVDAAYAELVAAGGTSVAPPKDSPWGRRVVVADPDGHRVELTAG
jgi:lactoylglutathione lyase